MKMTQLFLLLGAAVMTIGAAERPPTTPPSEPEIVVRGAPTPKEARTVASQFTQSVAGGPIARWNGWLCFSVEGLSQDQSAVLLGRIKKNAADLGLRINDNPSCTWNVLIGFTSDADTLAARLVKDHPGLFRDYIRYGLASHHDRDVLAAPRPVRWLPVERSISAVGTGAGVDNEDASHIDDSSHISTNFRSDKSAEIIIVDPQRISGVSWQQLADYLSMVILTDPGMDESFTGDSSIMSIFAERDQGRAGPPELTIQDRRLLRGYYRFDPYLPPHQQIATIAQSLRTALPASSGQSGPAEPDPAGNQPEK